MRFNDLVGVDKRPDLAAAAMRQPLTTDTDLNLLTDAAHNNGFVTGLVDNRRGNRMKASRRGFLRGSIAAAAASTAITAANLFGPARKVEAQSGVVGTYPRRILQYCPPYNSGDNCQPGCGSSPICTDCCGSDGFFRNDPGNGYSLYAGGCGDGDIADGWLWRFKGKCGNCAEIEYRCSDGFVQTDTGPAPFICRTVTDCVPLPEGEAPGPDLADAARDTNWRPAGALEIAIDNGGSVTLNGWISDGSGVPVQMRIVANNQIVHLGTAALSRPDIPASRRGSSPNVGFAVSFPLDPGQYKFCVDALSGVLTATVGCVNLDVGSGGSVRGPGSTGSITPPSAPTTPPSSANDQSTPSPTPSPTPGEVVLPVAGTDGLATSSASPTYGAVQVIRRSAETTGFVSGWAGDPDTDEAAYIDVLVDGESVAVSRTDLPRPDVASAFAKLSTTTGFALSFPLPAEAVEVCVVAVSPDDGERQPLGCRMLSPAPDQDDDPTARQKPTATGADGADAWPGVYGGIDLVEIVPGGAVITGWAFDPNDRDQVIEVEALASGQRAFGETGVTNENAQRRYGIDALCGFELQLELPSGTHDLTVRATSTRGDQFGDFELGQQSIVVP